MCHVSPLEMCLERKEKTGTGKKLERTLFFPFPFLHFLTIFFPVFGKNRQKRVKKGWNGGERPFHAIPNFRIWRDSILLCHLKPVFAPVPTLFLPLSKPVLDPFPNPFLPLSTPILAPFLYCLAIISRSAPVTAQPLDHVGSSPVRGPVGGLYSW